MTAAVPLVKKYGMQPAVDGRVSEKDFERVVLLLEGEISKLKADAIYQQFEFRLSDFGIEWRHKADTSGYWMGSGVSPGGLDQDIRRETFESCMARWLKENLGVSSLKDMPCP